MKALDPKVAKFPLSVLRVISNTYKRITYKVLKKL